METIRTFRLLKEVINANAGRYTYDYTDGCTSGSYKEIIEIDIDYPDLNGPTYSGYLYIFKDQEQLNQFILEESNNFDPTQGADDQYYDYNPSQLEAILWAMLSTTPDFYDHIAQILLPKLNAFIQDEEQDEDMVTMYKSYIDTIQYKNALNLEILSMLNDMKQHL